MGFSRQIHRTELKPGIKEVGPRASWGQDETVAHIWGLENNDLKKFQIAAALREEVMP